MNLKFLQYGHKGILVRWPNKISQDILNEMQSFIGIIHKERNDVKHIHHAYNEVLIQFDKRVLNFEILKEALNKNYQSLNVSLKKKAKLWKVPVCYDLELAPDLEIYLQQKGLNKAAFVELYSQAEYLVHFIGFLPGFLYLSGLDNSLAINRKGTPSKNIKRGTVAIGGTQTGIYPQDSPGGWYGVGYTPISFFEPKASEPVWAKPGDRIKFIEISKAELDSIKKAMSHDNYKLESEPYD